MLFFAMLHGVARRGLRTIGDGKKGCARPPGAMRTAKETLSRLMYAQRPDAREVGRVVMGEERTTLRCPPLRLTVARRPVLRRVA